jgi:multimeric flavodoxin WrbA
MVTALFEGMEEAGAEVENVFLARQKYGHCRGCLACWVKTPGKCTQKDDMAELLSMYMGSDIVVMATPLYVDNISGLMKNFMDRLIPFVEPYFEPDENGETRHVRTVDYPKIVVMSNSGFPEQSHFQVLRLLFRRVARNMDAELVGEIYRGGGGILGLREKNEMLVPMIDNYLVLVKTAGREIVQSGAISEETTRQLEEPMVPTDLYNSQVNALWDKLKAKHGVK